MLLLGIPGSRNPFGYDRPLEAGQVIGVDTGARVGMYTIDYTRWGVLGPATDGLRRMYDALLEVNRTMAAALGPGVTCSEIYRVGIEAIEKACSRREWPGAVRAVPHGTRAGHADHGAPEHSSGRSDAAWNPGWS